MFSTSARGYRHVLIASEWLHDCCTQVDILAKRAVFGHKQSARAVMSSSGQCAPISSRTTQPRCASIFRLARHPGSGGGGVLSGRGSQRTAQLGVVYKRSDTCVPGGTPWATAVRRPTKPKTTRRNGSGENHCISAALSAEFRVWFCHARNAKSTGESGRVASPGVFLSSCIEHGNTGEE